MNVVDRNSAVSHYFATMTSALAGLEQFFGQTDRRCERPVGTVHSTHDLAATFYHLLGIDCTREYRGQDGRPHLLNYHGRPITAALA